jgi:UDP-2-acetamido-2-deoxy-ribo-hexuluronate aminotransferase
MDIRMVDLKGQYEKIKAEIKVEFERILDNTAFINGPTVQDFTKNLSEYLNVKHVIPCANGTDALQIAMMALDLQPGDEVITTPFTFIATAEVIELLRLKPVFIDVHPDSFNIDEDKIEEVITSKTKAIVPVHLFGQCSNMNRIMEIAKKHDLFVIEDNAQAIGANCRYEGAFPKAGTIGHIGCTSFFPSKNLGGYGDGGALFTNDDALAEKLAIVVNHGMKVRYYHDVIGVNSRLDSLQAAVLKVKLQYLDDYISARQKAADYYDNAFSEIQALEIPTRADFSSHVFHQYTLKVKNGKRDELQKYLMDKGVPAMIYYPVPLHLQKAFENAGFNKGDFTVTEKLCEEVISLPMHTELNEEQLEFITKVVKSFF